MVISISGNTQDFMTAVAIGAVRNSNGNAYRLHSISAENHEVSTTPSALTSLDGPFFWGTSPMSVRVRAGGNAADAAAGAGARTIRVTGLDANGLEASEVVSLAGASASASTSTLFWRVYGLEVETVGAYTGANVGDIQLETTSSDTLLGILADEGQSHHGCFTVPADCSAHLISAGVGVESAKVVTFNVYCREEVMEVVTPRPRRIFRHLANLEAGFYQFPARAPQLFPPLTDIFIEASVAASTGLASAVFDFVLIPNK